MATVLVVDDSAVDRRLAGGLLEKIPDLAIEFAEDGFDALEQMKVAEPDVVLADIQMPKFDGLRLVQAMSLHHAHVPVVLMTRQGSEEIAIEALKQGASSYVPKSQLADRLADTILNLLAKKDSDRSYERLIQCSTKTEFEFQMENDAALIDPLTDLVQQIAVSMGVCPVADRLRLGLALEEALLNAIYHGNLEIDNEQLQASRENLLTGGKDLVSERQAQSPYKDRRTHCHVQIVPDEARFVIRDDGRGFDVAALSAVGEANAMDGEGGRGLVLMRTFMDEVTFNESGNEVTMIKRRPAE